MKEATTIKEVSRILARDTITKFHYLGAKGFRYKVAYGLFFGDDLCGVAVYHNVSAPETCVGAFGLARNEQEGIYELGRLVMVPKYNGGEWTSHLLGKSMRQLKHVYGARAIITYADSSLHRGGIYRAVNMRYYGLTTAKKDFYVNGKIQERGKTKGVAGEWKPRPQKHRFAIVYDKKLLIQWQEKKDNP